MAPALWSEKALETFDIVSLSLPRREYGSDALRGDHPALAAHVGPLVASSERPETATP
jgi:hypothetical protein